MKTVIPLDIVPLGEDNSYHLFVRCSIDGKKYDMLIDTGASHTIFDASLIPEIPADEATINNIQSAGIHAGEVKTSFGHIKKFKLGDLKCKDWTVVLIDLTHVNELYKKFADKRVAGLIGSDFLLVYDAIIDYKKMKLVLRNIRKK